MELGTISHGTLNTDHLGERFADALRTYDRDAYNAIMEDYDFLCTECEDCIGSCECEEWHVTPEFVDALQDALQECAPPYAYFGTTEGDGSDFGFWPSVDTLMEDARNAPDHWTSWPCEYDGKHFNGYCCVISDHGNVSLMNASDHSSIWAIV